jgi:NADPH-dependent F420 reductase
VVLGPRSAVRGATEADRLRSEHGQSLAIEGTDNASACDAARTVLLAIPHEGHDDLVAELAPHLAGKTVVTCGNPLGFDERGPFGVEVPAGSIAESTAAALPDATVVGAFHHLSAVSLRRPGHDLSGESVLVCGDDEEANAAVAELASDVTGGPAVVAGPLRLARQLEPFTAVLISVNRRYRARSGLSLTGLPATRATA